MEKLEVVIRAPELAAALANLVEVAREAVERDHARNAFALQAEEQRTEQAKLAHENGMARLRLEADELAFRREEYADRKVERAERKAEEAVEKARRLADRRPG